MASSKKSGQKKNPTSGKSTSAASKISTSDRSGWTSVKTEAAQEVTRGDSTGYVVLGREGLVRVQEPKGSGGWIKRSNITGKITTSGKLTEGGGYYLGVVLFDNDVQKTKERAAKTKRELNNHSSTKGTLR